MHPQRLILLYVASNSGKRYWDCKLPCIEAQIELSSTFVYEQKMSTSGSSTRNSHLIPEISVKKYQQIFLLEAIFFKQ